MSQSANRSKRRKREAALASARKAAEQALAVLERTPVVDEGYHEARVRAEAFTGVVGLMEAQMRKDGHL